jgi:DNA polymerase sigma
MRISHAKKLIKHFGSMYRDLYFTIDLIQIIINIVTLGCKPDINLELHKTFFQEFFQSMTANDSARTLIEACGDHNSIWIENHMKDTPLL